MIDSMQLDVKKEEPKLYYDLFGFFSSTNCQLGHLSFMK